MSGARVLGRFAAPHPEGAALDWIVRRALEEDAAFDDRTTLPLSGAAKPAVGSVHAREAGVLAGARVFRRAFELVDPAASIAAHGLSDGARFEAGDIVITIEGPGTALLAAERVALNFLQRLSGIATATEALVRIARGRIAVSDTRKTTPGLRALEKYAVAVGGGVPHRPDLRSMVMLKENHLAFAGGMRAAVAAIRADPRSHELPLTIEARTTEEALLAAELGADRVLLDNMAPDAMRRVVDAMNEAARRPGEPGRPELEASGGVRRDTIDAIAACGVDVASSGSLTHGAHSIDFSFLFEGVA